MSAAEQETPAEDLSEVPGLTHPEDVPAEPAGPDGIEDAVAWARSAADAVDKALLGYEPDDWQDAVRVLYSLRRVIETLRTSDASLVRWLYLHGEHGIHLHVEGVPGDVGITRGRSKERWAAPEAVHAYVDRQVEAIGGEFPDPRQVIEWVLEVLPATQSTALRKKPLREAGLDLEDFYTSEPGSLQVNLPRAPR